ncbi:hypothetical protein M2103_000001, partial [Ereboglobus sp. PH5-5]|uniref:hypothetical protein n=1 Tax=Ereboglobus sp. PH5-5 TaxID=2940529 RepID=UPI0024058072
MNTTPVRPSARGLLALSLFAFLAVQLPAQDYQTNTYTSSIPITIGPDTGTASTYPLAINVTGVRGVVSDVRVTLTDLTHSRQAEVQALLAHIDSTVVLAGGTGSNPVNTFASATITFSDAASGTLPYGTNITGAVTYKPTQYGTEYVLPSGPPAAPYGTTLSAFDGLIANGAWNLYVADSANQDGGSLSGWSLTIDSIYKFKWTGGATPNSSLLAAGNWNVNLVPTSGLDLELTFADNTNLAPVINSNYSARTFIFDSTAGSFTIGGSGNLTLREIFNSSVAVQTITNNISAEAGALLTGSSAAGSSLILSGSIFNTGTLLKIGDGSLTTTGTVHSLVQVNAGNYTNQGRVDTTGIAGETIGVRMNSTGLLTNTGYIEGRQDGVEITAAGRIVNFGTITSATTGVYSQNAAALVSNTIGGLITSADRGVLLNDGGTAANAGTIRGDNNGVLIYGASGELTNSGLIEGTNGGGAFITGTGAITNSGTIRAGRLGVGFNNAASILNNRSGGLVTGGTYGVWLNDGGTVANSGTIIGTDASGVTSYGNATLVSNTTGGVITGGTYGVSLNAGGTAINSGSITGGETGVSSHDNATLVSNTTGGRITGGTYGVNLTYGGTLANIGVIVGTNGVGVISHDNATLVSNTTGGLIQGGAQGINLTKGGTIANTGTIIGTNASGVSSNDGATLVTNETDGLIRGGAYGVDLAAGGALTNSGSITGGGFGVFANNNATLVSNTTGGVITGGTYGVNLNTGGGTIANTGTIIGTNASGVISYDAATLVTNNAAALIAGGSSGVVLNAGGTVANSGTISGTNDYAVRVNAGAAEVTNNASGVIDGGVYAGGTTTLRNDGAITGNRGVWLGASSTLSGTGSINVTGTALTLANGYVYTNTLAPVGGLVGISFIGTGSLGNSGTITGTADAGVEAKNASIAVTNAATGVITGGSYGINLVRGGTITNSGTILGTTTQNGSVGISATGGLTDITNSGHIEGHSTGAYFGAGAAGSTILNSGTIRALGGSEAIESDVTILVTNTTGGLIEGADTGVWLKGGGTVANFGVITGMNTAGILAQNTPVLVTNAGQITGDAGVLLNAGGTVANSGTIHGENTTGIFAGTSATITNNPGARIEGNTIGVQLNGGGDITNNSGALVAGRVAGVSLAAGGTIENSGTIRGGAGGTDYGVYSNNNATLITNNADGSITAGIGIRLAQGGTVANSGTIQGTTAIGIRADNIATITNNAGALIQGGARGITLVAGGTITNSNNAIIRGTAAGSQGIQASTAPVEIRNDQYATITGDLIGVSLDAGGTITNTGRIEGRDPANGVGVYGGSSGEITVTNDYYASIIAGGYVGVQLAGDGTVANTGTIIGTGAGSYGVRTDGGAVDITNDTRGLIRGEAAGAYLAGGGMVTNVGLIEGGIDGMELDGGATITNSGTIQGIAGDGIRNAAVGSLTDITNNSTGALIHGQVHGVNVAGDLKLANTGTIHGEDAEGVLVSGRAEITNQGYIEGSIAGVNLAGATATDSSVSNSGTIKVFDPGEAAIYIEQNGARIDNLANGLIEGEYGIQAEGSNISTFVTNAAGGWIHGDYYGVSLQSGTVANAGYIYGDTAVLFEQNGTVTNSGTIDGNAYGIKAINAAAVVENTGGVITGDVAVHLAAGGTVTNSGTINGGSTGVKTDSVGAATITNNTGGLINGGWNGVWLDGGGTVTNSGTILGGNDSGVRAYNEVVVVENTGGQIQGGLNGVWLGEGGRVRNTGAITGTAAGSYGIYSGAGAEVNNEGGAIKGGLTGVHMTGSSTITNTGTIIGTGSAGIYSKDIAELANTGGRVEGGKYGVQLNAGGTVTNSGTIRGTDFTSKGIYSGSLATIINNAGGLIEGGYEGVNLAAGGTVTNAGAILGKSPPGSGIFSTGSTGTIVVTNESSGLIEGFADGINTAGTLELANSGTILGTTVDGVRAERSSEITNTTASSLISGGTIGVHLAGGGTVANAGTIRGTDLVGIYSGSLATIINNATGLISGGTVGVHLAGGGTVKNTGTISVTNINAGSLSNPSPHAGILVETRGAEIINTGLVQGYSGITIRAGGTLVNSGTIAGVGTAGSGVFGKYTVVATNTIGGVITGTIYALNLPDNASSIVNLWNSSTLAGSLRIEGVSAQLTLNGDAGTEQLYSDAVTGDTDFTGILIKQGAGTWTIDKNLNTNPLAQMRQKLTRVDAGKLIVDWEKHTLNNAAVNIAAGAILEVRTANTATTTTLVNPLTGDGLLDLVGTATVNAPNVTFALSSSMGSAFSGTVGVSSAYGHKTVFDLATSETALTNATLKLNANSETTLDANREIGGLDLAGGTFLVKTDTTAAGLPPYRLDVDNLMSTAGGSKIGVDTEVLSGINPPLPPGDGLNQNVFDMDVIPPDTLLSGTIVHGANSTIANGAAFDMIDSDGNALPSGTSTISFGQNGLYPVGVNSYGYNAIHKTNGSGGGDIVFNYGLISIESVHATELIILDPTGSLDKTLSAKLTGSGAGFEFRGSEAITLAHTGNDYTGSTLINESAWIIGGVADVIASSTKVTLATVDTGFDLGGNDQRLQNLNGLGNIRLGDKTLTVANTETGLELSGVIDGTGNVTLADDSEWTLLGDNTYTGVTTIGAGAQLQLGNGGATGMIADASAVANTGTLTINRSDDLVYGGTVTGAGVFIQRGAGTTILTGANKIDGGLEVENGALVIGQDDETGWYSSTIAANVRVDENAGIIFNRSDEVTYDGVISGSGAVATIGSGTLAIKNAQTYEGETYVIGSTLRLDTTNAIERSEEVVLFGGTLDLNNNNQRIQNLHAANGVIRYSTNSGTATAYTNLTVAGELDGTSTHHMNVDLVGKKSDTLTVAGLASGTHYVHFDPTTDPSLLSDPQRKYALEVVKLGAGSTAEFDSDGVESGMHTYKL